MSIRVGQKEAVFAVAETPSITVRISHFLKQTAEKVVYLWSMVVFGIKQTGVSINFIFFRVVEFFHPVVGPRVEMVFLRAKCMWQGVKMGWQEQNLKGRIAELEIQKAEVQADRNAIRTDYVEVARTRDSYARDNLVLNQEGAALSLDHEHLSQSHASLKGVESAWDLERQALMKDVKAGAEETEAVIEEKALLAEQMKVLEEKLKLAIRSKNSLSTSNVNLCRMIKELSNRVQELESQLQDLRDQPLSLGNGKGGEPPFSAPDKIAQLGNLITLLRGQRQDALSGLQQMQVTSDPDPEHPFHIHVGTLLRIERDETAVLQQVWNSVPFYSNPCQPMAQFLPQEITHV